MILSFPTLISLPKKFIFIAALPKPDIPALAVILVLSCALWQGQVTEGCGMGALLGCHLEDEAGGGPVPQDRGPSITVCSLMDQGHLFTVLGSWLQLLLATPGVMELS